MSRLMTRNTTAVIVDDEMYCRDALSGLLQRRFQDITVLGTAGTVPEGLALVDRERPTVLFLDVELGRRTGFDLLQAIGPDRPHIIFTTGHEAYAVKAIRFNALDFLLKPVDPEELKAALDKVRQAERSLQHPDQFEGLMRNLKLLAERDRRIALPVSEGLEIVETDNIVYCESDSNYTVVHQKVGKRLVISRTLKEFEDMLGVLDFIRVHHSHLINVRHVRKYIRGEGGEVIMSDGTNVAVSRRKKQELMDGLSRL